MDLMKKTWHLEELVEHWTLLPKEIEQLVVSKKYFLGGKLLGKEASYKTTPKIW